MTSITSVSQAEAQVLRRFAQRTLEESATSVENSDVVEDVKEDGGDPNEDECVFETNDGAAKASMDTTADETSESNNIKFIIVSHFVQTVKCKSTRTTTTTTTIVLRPFSPLLWELAFCSP